MSHAQDLDSDPTISNKEEMTGNKENIEIDFEDDNDIPEIAKRAGCGIFLKELFLRKSVRTYDFLLFTLIIYSILSLISNIVDNDKTKPISCKIIQIFGIILILTSQILGILTRCYFAFTLIKQIKLLIGFIGTIGGILFFISFGCFGCETGWECYSCLIYYDEPFLVFGLCLIFTEMTCFNKLLNNNELRRIWLSRLMFLFCFFVMLSLYAIPNNMTHGEWTLVIGATGLTIILIFYFYFSKLMEYKIWRFICGIFVLICGILMCSGYLSYVKHPNINKLPDITIAIIALMATLLLGQDLVFVESRRVEQKQLDRQRMLSQQQ